MEKLTNFRREELFLEDFQRFPIWTWDSDNVGRIPVLNAEVSLDKHYPLFIKATFKSNVYKFDGYLVGGDSYYAFNLFFGGKTISFNINASKLNKSSLESLFQLLGCKPFRFFPLSYESDVILKDGKKISGTLDFKID